MNKLSVVILAKNEERQIVDCIKNVSFADEIVVIDDNSKDKTAELARENGAKVYTRKLDNFSSQRNFGLSKTTNKWVLFMDADERITPELAKEIVSVVR